MGKVDEAMVLTTYLLFVRDNNSKGVKMSRKQTVAQWCLGNRLFDVWYGDRWKLYTAQRNRGPLSLRLATTHNSISSTESCKRKEAQIPDSDLAKRCTSEKRNSFRFAISCLLWLLLLGFDIWYQWMTYYSSWNCMARSAIHVKYFSDYSWCWWVYEFTRDFNGDIVRQFMKAGPRKRNQQNEEKVNTGTLDKNLTNENL